MLKGRQERQRDVSLYWSADLKFQPTNFRIPHSTAKPDQEKFFLQAVYRIFSIVRGAAGGSKGYIKAEGKDDVEIEQIHPFFAVL